MAMAILSLGLIAWAIGVAGLSIVRRMRHRRRQADDLREIVDAAVACMREARWEAACRAVAATGLLVAFVALLEPGG